MARYNRRYQNFRPTCSDDAVVSGIDEYVAYLAAFLERGNMEMFLKRLAELSAKLRSEPLWGRALFVPELDELVRRASLIITPKPNPSANSKLLVHIATEVYPWGGHTRVIEDIAASLPEYRHALIITRMHEAHPDLACLKPRFDELNLKVHLLGASSWAEKARQLSSLVTVLAPDAILLFGFPDDSVAYTSVAGHSAPRVLFLHHADHHPCLGALRVDYTHVDLTPACHKICASHPCLHASMLNLTVKDTGTVQLVQRHPIIGVTCGSPQKYAGSSEFSYAQLLAALFSAGVHQILHIGDMPEEQKNQIRAGIAASGQEAHRVIFLPNTPSLAAKLVETSPDFYLTSHPTGSGKATVEALSVGLPILYVRPASTPSLLNSDMTFTTSVPVSTLEQVPAAVHRLETEKAELAKRSRAVYEKHYSPAAFREGLLSAMGIDPDLLRC
ncbi:MAG: hypothetical protein WBE86_14190 [Candidatus Acidiferrales bacterium]